MNKNITIRTRGKFLLFGLIIGLIPALFLPFPGETKLLYADMMFLLAAFSMFIDRSFAYTFLGIGLHSWWVFLLDPTNEQALFYDCMISLISAIVCWGFFRKDIPEIIQHLGILKRKFFNKNRSS